MHAHTKKESNEKKKEHTEGNNHNCRVVKHCVHELQGTPSMYSPEEKCSPWRLLWQYITEVNPPQFWSKEGSSHRASQGHRVTFYTRTHCPDAEAHTK